MPSPSRLKDSSIIGLVALAVLLVFGWRAGQDYTWDFLNYHFYNPFAWLHGRVGADVMPAMMQSYFNPLPNLPSYLLIRHLPPVAAAAALTVLHVVDLLTVFWLAGAIAPGASRAARLGVGLLCVAVAVSAPAFLPQIGSSSTDILLSGLVLGGLGALVRAFEGRWRWAALGGLLIGASAGLKLTNGLFVLGAATGLLAVRLPWRSWWRLAGAYGAGAAVGVLALALPWCAVVYRAFGNPLFPYLNNVFKSPWGQMTSGQDTNFIPSPLWRGLAFPLDWASGRNPAGEIAFRDVRFVVLAAALAACAVVWLLRRRPATEEPARVPVVLVAVAAFLVLDVLLWQHVLVSQRPLVWMAGAALGLVPLVAWLRRRPADAAAVALPAPSPDVVRFLVAFTIASGLVWLKAFSIERYLLPLEMAMGVILYAALTTVVRSERARLATFAAACLLVVVWAKPASIQRLPWSAHWIPVTLPAAARDAGALYVMTGHEPYAALIPSFPADARFVRIDGNYPLQPGVGLGAKAQALVRAHRGPVRALISLNEEAPSRAKLEAFGWRPGRTLGAFDDVVTRFTLVELSTSRAPAR